MLEQISIMSSRNQSRENNIYTFPQTVFEVKSKNLLVSVFRFLFVGTFKNPSLLKMKKYFTKAFLRLSNIRICPETYENVRQTMRALIQAKG
jgi:hypothetical protein